MSLLPLLFCIVGAAAFSSKRSTNYTICETSACNLIADSIQQSIDESRDPCTNFYEYGCGLWSINNPIPPNDIIWSVDHIVDASTSLRLKEVLEEESEYDNLDPIIKLKQYYRSCLDEDAIEKQGLEPAQSMLDAYGGWPVQFENPESNAGNYTWQELDDLYMRTFFISSILDMSFIPEEEDSTKNILTISQDIPSIIEEAIVASPRRQFSVSDITKVGKTIKAFQKNKEMEIPAENFIANAEQLLAFQEDLRNISEHENEIQKGMKKNQDRMTIAELQEYYDQAGTQNSTAQINWLHKIQEFLKPANKIIDASYPVLVYNKQLFHKLAHLLNATPQHVIVSYVHWNILNQLMPYLNKEMRDIEFESTYVGYNITEQKPRWKICIDDIPLKDALSYLFIKKYLSPNTIPAVTEMLNNIKEVMKERILHSKWTNENAKNFMIDKINNIISLIGYPDWYNNETAFIELYKGLEIGENYFKNKVSSITYDSTKKIKNVQKPVDRNDWRGISPVILNAFYAAPLNLMVIPAAEIQDPYFTSGMPLAVNYGGIGMIVGHELAHSFDTTGIEYDKFGNKIVSDAETSATFGEKVKCFIDQYNNFTIVQDKNGQPIQLNGLFTKDENVADNIGLEIAYAAFQKHKQAAGPQPKLPGLTNFNDDQLFFLSFVNAWCMSTTDDVEIATANQNNHSPNRFRIIGTVSNMESFSDSFNCPTSSPVNQDLKCSLWK